MIKSKGFSLVEVLITLVIIAIIASFAYPRYQKTVTRSKQTEAKTMLKALHSAQEMYKIVHNTYAPDISKLDIELPPDSRYSYEIQLKENGKSYLAKAAANLDSDDALDEWSIDSSKNLENIIDDSIE